MNELSLKVLNHVSGVKNFLKNINKDGEKGLYSQMDVKVFFCFEGDNEQKKKTKKKHRTKETNETNSKKSDASATKKFEYSLREIVNMNYSELKNKIFTFDHQLAMSGDLTQIREENQVMNKLIKSLKCMFNIDEEYVPTFRFF